jgi:hypothetical protein
MGEKNKDVNLATSTAKQWLTPDFDAGIRHESRICRRWNNTRLYLETNDRNRLQGRNTSLHCTNSLICGYINGRIGKTLKSISWQTISEKYVLPVGWRVKLRSREEMNLFRGDQQWTKTVIRPRTWNNMSKGIIKVAPRELKTCHGFGCWF